MKKGFILSFEGGEACGKSTQVKSFKEYLDKKGIDYVALREPGGSELGEQVREVLLHKNININLKAEILLFNAARAQLIEEKIKPALEEGKLVLLDRFYHSTLVYQGYATGTSPKKIKSIIDFATDGITTDLTLVLNLPAQTAFERKEKENLQDRIESRGLEFYKALEKGFLELAKQDRRHVKLIDATDTIEGVFNQIVETFEKYYKN